MTSFVIRSIFAILDTCDTLWHCGACTSTNQAEIDSFTEHLLPVLISVASALAFRLSLSFFAVAACWLFTLKSIRCFEAAYACSWSHVCSIICECQVRIQTRHHCCVSACSITIHVKSIIVLLVLRHQAVRSK